MHLRNSETLTSSMCVCLGMGGNIKEMFSPSCSSQSSEGRKTKNLLNEGSTQVSPNGSLVTGDEPESQGRGMSSFSHRI